MPGTSDENTSPSTLAATLTVGELADAVGVAQRATVANPPLVAYTGVLFTSGRGRLTVSGSDGDTTIACRASAPGSTSGRLLVVPRPLTQWLSTHRRDGTVTLSADGDDLLASVDGSPSYRFRGLSATFPDPKMSAAGLVEADMSGLSAAVAAVRHASEGTVRLRATAAGLWVETADSYRAAATLLAGVDAGELLAVAPIDPVAEMGRHQVTSIGVDPRGRELRGFSDRVRISTRVVAAGFPGVDGLLASIPNNTLRCSQKQLRVALSRLVAVAPEAPVHIRAESGVLHLSATDSERGEGSEKVRIDGDHREFSTAVAASYITAAIGAHTAENITLRWSEPLRPLYVDSTVDNNRNLSIVMPLKV